ncbi:MAG: DsrH/TusB family sulfur relay protein [Halomonas sp.]|nr:DsrH/TusB family sulfur metabolism protein [Halomonas sp.]MDN6297812.1 DsrH/TusB family sulfur relay protein [Halomonas sp.]MDN6336472.1 DsrH/TusB family sulfur relay protein [Halomonas sp.]
MILHILNQAPQSGQAAAQALAAMAPEDHLILIEEAVFAVLDAQWQGWHVASERIHVLEDDVASRGLVDITGRQQPELLSVEAFVTLTAEVSQTVSWY